jgi:hypothetical protein
VPDHDDASLGVVSDMHHTAINEEYLRDRACNFLGMLQSELNYLPKKDGVRKDMIIRNNVHSSKGACHPDPKLMFVGPD